MLISDNSKSIDFSIISYEFPREKSLKKEFNYDANWLLIKVVFSDENINKIYTDICLLTCELSELVNALQQIINSSENSYMSDFMEPYLSVCITKVDEFINFALSFVYSTIDEGWPTVEVTAKWTMKEAKDKLKELKDME
ncbi:MAG: hypothetical protein K2K38_04365, partial [Clostridia bacterium]|nr:hypothetical protein [Clostridia bacterium]